MNVKKNFSIDFDDVNNCEIETIFDSPKSFSHFDMESHFSKLSKFYVESGDEHSRKVAYLLMAIFNFSFSRSGDLIGFEPKAILYPNRGCRPSDFEGIFLSVLKQIAEKSNNHYINSRVYDVIWMGCRSDYESGNSAIECYSSMITDVCDIIEKDGVRSDLHFFYVVDCVERGVAISSLLAGRKKNLNKNIVSSILRLYELLLKKGIFDGFYRLSNLIYKYELLNEDDIAVNAEVMSMNHFGEAYFEAVKKMLSFAGYVYKKCGDIESGKRCYLESVNLTLQQAEKSNSGSIKSHWYRQAIGEYRSIGGMEREISRAREKLSQIRDSVIDEMHLFSLPLDLKDVIKEIEEGYGKLGFNELIKLLIVRFSLTTIDQIKSEVKETANQSAFLRMSGQSIHDEDGRLIAYNSPLKDVDYLSDDDAISTYLRSSSIQHQVYVDGEFEVVRRFVLGSKTLNENTFDPITHQSYFVPPGYSEIFSLAFYKLWQGDYLSACYILIPQVENSMRWVLELYNKDTTKIDPKLLEEATSISQMLANLKPTLEDIFTPKIVLSLDMLFNFKGGPSLRHNSAHGRMNAGQCYSPTSVYACCFIFYLTCLPLFKDWDDLVAPHLH